MKRRDLLKSLIAIPAIAEIAIKLSEEPLCDYIVEFKQTHGIRIPSVPSTNTRWRLYSPEMMNASPGIGGQEFEIEINQEWFMPQSPLSVFIGDRVLW